MRVFRKYVFYKRMLHGLFTINILLIVSGIVSLFHFFKTQDITALELAAIGFGTLIFGIVAPAFLLHQMMQTMKEMRRQTEEAVALWVAGWLKNYKAHDGDVLHDPYFWVNIGLLSLEIFGENSKHPLSRMLAEFAPIVKHELHKAGSKKKSRKQTA